MTTTYKIADVPSTGTEETRYALGTTPQGHASSPADCAALCFNQLTEERIAQAPRLDPERKTVALKRVAINEAGEYVLVSAGSVTAAVTASPIRVTKFRALPAAGGALLDLLFRGEEPVWSEARDDAIYDAALSFATSSGLAGYPLRRFSEDLNRLLCLRAGLVVSTTDLP